MNLNLSSKLPLFAIVATTCIAGAFAECELNEEFTVDGACTVSSIQAICPNITEEAAQAGCKDATLQFSDIIGNYQFDKEYMDGGTILNDDLGALDVKTKGAIDRAEQASKSNIIGWPVYDAVQAYKDAEVRSVGHPQGVLSGPPYMSNFDLDEGCNANTVMCCYVDGAPGQAGVCHPPELEKSKFSHHTRRGHGWGKFGEEPPQNAYCVGFTWNSSISEPDLDYALKGNLLLDISYGNRANNGYGKNIPGSPLCGCIEQMPTVTAASCKTISGPSSVSYTFLYESNDRIVSKASNLDGEVKITDCSDNLKDEAEKKGNDIKDKIAGNGGCVDAITQHTNSHFKVPMASIGMPKPPPADDSRFVPFAGKGMFHHTYQTDDPEFLAEQDQKLREIIGNDNNFILRRYCPYCFDSHVDIYYVRKTPLPEGLNLYDLLLNNWFNKPLEEMPDEELPEQWNTLKTDFDLYSSLQDAIDQTPGKEWKYCNYNHGGVGFPRDCGPVRHVSCQWNSYGRGMCGGESPRTHLWSVFTG